MKLEKKTETLYEIPMMVKGNEPFLSYTSPRMIVQITSRDGRSHQFYDGPLHFFPSFKKGDVVAVQLCRITQVPMTWYKRLLLKLVEVL